MKNFVIRRMVILFLFNLFISETHSIELKKPRIFVRNQMIPDILSISYDFGINRDNRDRVGVYLIPFTLSNLSYFKLYWGGGYGSECVNKDYFKLSREIDDKNLQSIYLDLLNLGSIGKEYFYFNYFSIGSFSDRPFNRFDRSFKGMGLLSFGYKWSVDLSTSFGTFTVLSSEDKTSLPSMRVSYSPGDWLFDLWFPTKFELRYLWNQKLQLFGVVRLDIATFSIDHSNIFLESQKVVSSIGFKYQILQDIWLKLGVDSIKESIYLDNKRVDDLDSSFGLNLSLSYSVNGY